MNIDIFMCLFLLCTCNSNLIQCLKGKQPNILFVLADDYGWNDIGYHGSEIKTPTLDRLASEGVKLENYYIQPLCTPSRSQLLSGRYQIHTGLQHGVIHPLEPNGLPLEFPTIADELKSLGYSTHMVGKWHLGYFKEEYLPNKRGFDSFFGYLNGAEDYFTHERCASYEYPNTKRFVKVCGLDLLDNSTPVRTMKGKYSAEMFAEQVQKIVKRHSSEAFERPLFIYLPFQSVHSPLQVPDKFVDQYKNIKDESRRIYAGMVSAMDEAIKNIIETYKEMKMWDDTIMIFSTDNGGHLSDGGNNYPLKGGKASLWEGGIRGVGFVHGKQLEQTGVENNQLVHISDWFPTLVNLAGGNTNNLQLDGYNVWDAISKGTPSPREELLHNIDPTVSLRGQKLYDDTFDNRVSAALRYKNWKILTGNPDVEKALHKRPPSDADEILDLEEIDKEKNLWLYNLNNDPYEYTDVSDANPELVRFLLDRLAYYNSTAVPCRNLDPDPNANPFFNDGVWGPWM